MDQVIYRCGECELDTANRTFRRGGTHHALEPRVFAVLVQLISRPGELLTRDQLLDSVWGHRYVTPSTLNRVIALARRALADDAEAPAFILTVHGAGYRYVGPVERTVAVPEPRARFGPPPSVRLPARLHTLIGREAELSQIDAMLASGRALTILGTGGMGKTQCALAFAHSRCDRYPDGVWFFDLAPMRRADEWLQALALALVIAPSNERHLVGKIAEGLRIDVCFFFSTTAIDCQRKWASWSSNCCEARNICKSWRHRNSSCVLSASGCYACRRSLCPRLDEL